MTQRLSYVLAALVLVTSGSASAENPDAQVPPPPPADQQQVVYVPVPPQQTYYVPGQGQPQPRQRRYREPYYEGMPIPPGGEIIERRKVGLMIPGLAIFAVSYISTLSYYAVSNDLGHDPPGSLAVPVFGPFIAMGHYHSSTGRVALGWSGVMQIGGVALFALGVVPRRYVQYYAGTGGSPSWALMPRAGGTEVGLDFGLRF